jgi:hypothetical protein
MLALCIIVLPISIVYYQNVKDKENFRIPAVNMGALGSADHLCHHIFMDQNPLFQLQCKRGFINELKYSGIIPEIDQDFRPDFCGDPFSNKFTKECTQKTIDEKSLQKHFSENCQGQNRCTIEMKPFLL